MNLRVKCLLLGASFVAGGMLYPQNGVLARQAPSRQVASAPADAQVLSLGANTIADMAERVAPGVVNIETDVEVPYSNLFQMFFNGQQMAPGGRAHKQMAHNAGSGFIVRADGYIVTNAHVVRGADKAHIADNIKVTLTDKRSFPAKVVGIDNLSDLAVIKVDAKDLPTLTMGRSANLRPGEFAVAIGNPLGFDHTVTLGIISAIGRAVTQVNDTVAFIQTDAAINPGNSGGPLLNLNGEVIGVNTAMQANAQNIGFSIPIDVAKSITDDLIANKQIYRPWLGIDYQDMDEPLARGLGLPPATKGVYIDQLFDGSPALAAGLAQGDIIEKIDGKEMLSREAIKNYVRAHKVNDILNFSVMRGAGTKTVAVSVGKFPDPVVAENTYQSEASDSAQPDVAKAQPGATAAEKDVVRPWLGIGMADVNANLAAKLGLPASTKGVLVSQLVEGGPAQSAGLQAGDVIQKIDGKDMPASQAVKDYVSSRKVDDTLNLFVLRGNSVKGVAVKVGKYPQ